MRDSAIHKETPASGAGVSCGVRCFTPERAATNRQRNASGISYLGRMVVVNTLNVDNHNRRRYIENTYQTSVPRAELPSAQTRSSQPPNRPAVGL